MNIIMRDKIIETLRVLSAVLVLCFILAAPAILAIVSSNWWLVVYLLYVVAYMSGSIDVEYLEDEEDEL